MAGLGHTTWATSYTPTSAEWQGHVLDQIVGVYASTAARGIALPSPDEGMMSYITGDDDLQIYLTQWQNIPILGTDDSLSIIGDVAAMLRLVRDGGGNVGSYVGFYEQGSAANRMGYVGYPSTDDLEIINEKGNGRVIIDAQGSGAADIRARHEGNERLIIDGVAYEIYKTDGTTLAARVTDSSFNVYDDLLPSADNSWNLGSASVGWATVFCDFIENASGGDFQGTVQTEHLIPLVDNTWDLGSASLRWDDVYATNGTIQTSDERFKTRPKQMKVGDALEMVAAMARSSINYYRPRRTAHQRSKPKKLHWGFSWQKLTHELGEDHAITVETDDVVDEETGEITITPNGARYEEGVAPLAVALDHALDLIDKQAETIAALTARIETLEAA